MSIAPPSDIVLDVARAADPRRLEAATTKLNALASGSAAAGPDAGAGDFHALLAEASGSKPAAPAPFQSRAGMAAPALSPYQKFEAVLLQTLVQEMLPKEDKLYGDAASADAYRGLLAEKLAEQLARSGRIGIARMIEKAHGPHPPVAAPAPPTEGA